MNARTRTVLIAILLVLGGGILALFIEHMILRRPAPGSPAAMHASTLAQLDSTLQLTPAQRDSIHALFMRHQPLIDSAWKSINLRVSATMDSVHQKVESLLEPEQVAAFHQWMLRQHGAHEMRH